MASINHTTFSRFVGTWDLPGRAWLNQGSTGQLLAAVQGFPEGEDGAAEKALEVRTPGF